MSQRWSASSRRPATALFAALTLTVSAAALTSAQQAVRSGGAQHHASPSHGATHALTPAQRAQVAAQYGRMPLQFEQNQGQAPAPIRFLSMYGAYEVALTPQQMVVNFKGRGASPEKAGNADGLISMQLAGANPNPTLLGEQELRGKVNYFLGNDPKQWHTGVSTFAKVRAKEVYPGVDLVYYGNNKQLEYDFVLKPGVDPGKIGLNFSGARSLRLEANGDLLLHAKTGEMRWKRPEVYQMIDGKRHLVAAHYTVRSERKGASHVGFEIAQYDRTRPLVIDPSLIVKYYNTLGSSAGNIETTGQNSMVADTAGNVYAAATSNVTSATYARATSVGGATTNTTPTFTKFPSGANAAAYLLVLKLDSSGALVYSDILGGSAPNATKPFNDVANSITIDNSLNVYLLGSVQSPDMPLVNAYQTFLGFSGNTNTTVNGQTGAVNHPHTNAYVAKLNAAGNTLMYASYFGGRLGEAARSVAVSANGASLYLAGITPTASNFPATGGRVDGATSLNSNGFQTAYGGSFSDAYLARLDDVSGGANYTSLVYCTLLGGGGPDVIWDVVVDPANAALVYAVGDTELSNTNTGNSDLFHALGANGFQQTFAGGDGGFLVKINTSQTGANSLIYNTFIGGQDSAAGSKLAINPAFSVACVGSGIVYVAGQTNATNFPVSANALQSTLGGGNSDQNSDAYLVRVDTTATGSGTKLYASYLGGGDQDYATGLFYNGTSLYMSGHTESTAATGAFPTTTGAIFTSNQGGANSQDGFVAKFTESNVATHAHTMDLSTYFGNSKDDQLAGIGVDSSGNIYVMGDTVNASDSNLGIYFGKLSINTPPVANAQSVTVNVNTAKAITLTATDADSDPLTYTVTSNPAHGTLSGTAPNLTYTPSNGYNGSDSFQFKANDGHDDSNIATVSITVVGAPTANSQSVSVNHNTAKAITLTGSDPNSPPKSLTYTVTSSPAHGTLSGTAPNVTYTPTANYQGSDSFQFTVNNGFLTSNTATVTLTVAAGVPTANVQSVSVNHNTAKPITLTGTDPDNPALSLTYAIATTPAHGTLSGFNAATGAVTYTPSANYQGSDSFTFTVSNGQNTSSPATVTLTVAAAAPTANAQTVAVAHNTATGITLTGSDPNSPALSLTYAIATTPTHGTLSGFNASTGAVTYTPTAGYQGSDSFTFTVTNTGSITSSPATVTLNVAAGAPTANGQSVSANQDTAVGITLTGSDPNTPALSLTYAVTSNPAHGTLSGTAPNLTYTPNAGYSGPDSFQFTVNNGQLTSSPATVNITVNQTLIDVSTQIGVTAGPFTYNRATGTYNQVLTLTNNSGTAVTGPISVILNSLANATLANATGTTSALTPAGRPYVNALAATLPAGASTTVTLSFTKTGAGVITYTTQIVAGPGSR